MNTFSHITLSKIIYKKLKKIGIGLDKSAFVYGNFKPDFSVNLINKPHYMNDFYDYVKKEIHFLSKSHIKDTRSINAVYSQKLGIICHFLRIFFAMCITIMINLFGNTLNMKKAFIIFKKA